MDTWSELMEYRDLTDSAISQMRKSGKEAARVERDYKRLFARKTLELRADGNLPATLIKHVVEGDRDVSDAKFALDCAEVTYKADHEAAMSYKKRADDLRLMFEREWGRSE